MALTKALWQGALEGVCVYRAEYRGTGREEPTEGAGRERPQALEVLALGVLGAGGPWGWAPPLGGATKSRTPSAARSPKKPNPPRGGASQGPQPPAPQSQPSRAEDGATRPRRRLRATRPEGTQAL